MLHDEIASRTILMIGIMQLLLLDNNDTYQCNDCTYYEISDMRQLEQN